MFWNQLAQKARGHSMCSTMVGGGWRLAVGGGWQLAVGNSWLVAAGGGWRRLVVGDWWLVVGGGWQWLEVGDWSPLAVGGGWWLAVGGRWWLVCSGWWSLGAVLSKKKISSLKDRPAGTPTKQKTHSYLQPSGPPKHDRFEIPQIYPKNSVASVVELAQPTDIHAQSKLRQAFP